MRFNRNIRKGFLVSVSCVLATALYCSNSYAQSIYVDFSTRLNQDSLKKAIKLEVENQGFEFKERKKQLQKNDILLSIGSQAFAKNIKKYEMAKLHLAFYISKHDYLRITTNHPEVKNTRAIFSGQSLFRQWQLGKNLIPTTTRFSTLTTTQPSQDELTLKDKGVLFSYELDKNFSDVLTKALRDHPMLIIQENNAINTGENIRRILLSGYRVGTPVIGPNKSVVKAGALATVYSTREQILEALNNSLTRIKNNQPPDNCHPKSFEIFVNKQVANSFSITPLDNDKLKRMVNTAGGVYCHE